MVRRLSNLNQLRSFEAAARHLSFKDAADELCVTDAAVSHQIKALEADLGKPLFHRMTRQVHLTAAGKDLLPALTEALDQIAAATAAVGEKVTSGALTLSVAPYLGSQWLFPRLPRFHDAHPDITVQAHPSYEAVDFRTSDCAAALRYGAGNWPGAGQILVYPDMVGPVCARAMAAGRHIPMSPEEIATMALLCSAKQTDDWPTWFDSVGYVPDAPLNIIDVDHRGTAIARALSGSGVALVDTQITAQDEDAGNLVRINPHTIPRPRGVYVVYPDSDAPDPRVLIFAEWLKLEVCGSTPAE